MPKVTTEMLENCNLDIRKAKLGLHITENAVTLEKSRYLPEVGAFAEYGSADNGLWNDFTQKDAYTVGMQVKWNLFNGGSDAAKLEQAKIGGILNFVYQTSEYESLQKPSIYIFSDVNWNTGKVQQRERSEKHT